MEKKVNVIWQIVNPLLNDIFTFQL